jgi:glycosyltransferase involved in cell wall biosynthesis
LKVILSLDPIKYPLTGIGRYTYELAKALAQSEQIDSLRFFRGTRLCTAIPETAKEPNTIGWLHHRLRKSRIALELYRAIVPRKKAWALRGLEDHIFHGPNFYLPPFGGRSVVTIHDLSVFSWPECHPPERVRYVEEELELSLKRATVLITDSEFTRLEVTRQFNWPLERIHAVSLASADIFHPREPSVLSPLMDRYRLSSDGYCLFSGTIEPRKNIDTLLDAYTMLPAPVRRKWPLVLTGYQGWSSDNLHKRIDTAVREGWALYLGYVPAEHLPKLFAGARLFAFPSLYEGFGLPVLEAMVSGVPVVCSNASSLPEVVGDSAGMCDPLDVDELSRLILVGLEDENWREIAISKGLGRAAQFSWKRCADETIAAYEAALCV